MLKKALVAAACTFALVFSVSAASAASFNTASVRGYAVDYHDDGAGGCYVQILTDTDPFWAHLASGTGGTEDCSALTTSPTCFQASGQVAQTYVSGTMVGPIYVPPPIDSYQLEVSSWSTSSLCTPLAP
jgi:hypothetical protein